MRGSGGGAGDGHDVFVRRAIEGMSEEEAKWEGLEKVRDTSILVGLQSVGLRP